MLVPSVATMLAGEADAVSQVLVFFREKNFAGEASPVFRRVAEQRSKTYEEVIIMQERKAIVVLVLAWLLAVAPVSSASARTLQGEMVTPTNTVVSGLVGCGLGFACASIFTFFTGGLGAFTWAAALKACLAGGALGSINNGISEPRGSS